MRVSSTIMPTRPFEIIREGNLCKVHLYGNVTSHEETDSSTSQPVTMWDYDHYILTAEYRANLAADVEVNLDLWLRRGYDQEYDQEAGKVRAYRNQLLNDCDTVYCNAANWALMDDTKRMAWQEYKQKLRDVTEQEGFPFAVSWPVMPTEVF